MSIFYNKAAQVFVAVAAGGLLCTVPVSFKSSATSAVMLSIDGAQAEIGRPATPGSVAGVHRRVERRAVRRCAAGVTCNY
jgi:hypothetical protein